MASKQQAWRIFRMRGTEKWYLAQFESIVSKRNPKWIQIENLFYQVPMEFRTKAEAEYAAFELVSLDPHKIGQLEVECVPLGRTV